MRCPPPARVADQSPAALDGARSRTLKGSRRQTEVVDQRGSIVAQGEAIANGFGWAPIKGMPKRAAKPPEWARNRGAIDTVVSGSAFCQTTQEGEDCIDQLLALKAVDKGFLLLGYHVGEPLGQEPHLAPFDGLRTVREIRVDFLDAVRMNRLRQLCLQLLRLGVAPRLHHDDTPFCPPTRTKTG